MSAKDSFEDTDLPEKRTPKCSGCKTPYDVHTWADPGPYCTGKPEDSGANNYEDYGTEANEDPDVPEYVPASDGLEHVDEPDEEAVLLEKLHDLQLAEEALAKKHRVEKLKKAIADAEKRIFTLSKPPSAPTTTGPAVHVSSTLTNSVTSNTNAKSLPRLPLDDLLAGTQSSALSSELFSGNQSGNHTQQSTNLSGLPDPVSSFAATPDGPLNPPQALQESLMFLKPTQLPKGERVLRIPDFVDKLVSHADERTISEVGLTKLLVSYGPKKPKLENINLSQWVIANTRIYHTLLQLGKLPSSQDVQHYLAYTIKVMELSNRFTWASVLRYDDEFRHLQAIYNYPWSYDSPHLHTVILEPISAPVAKPPPTKPGSVTSSASFANLTTDGKVICRNYNRVKGCTLYDCHFAHVCNRKINGKACAQHHPFYTHQGNPKGTPPIPTPPMGPL